MQSIQFVCEVVYGRVTRRRYTSALKAGLPNM
jgi:hypothetical protein